MCCYSNSFFILETFQILCWPESTSDISIYRGAKAIYKKNHYKYDDGTPHFLMGDVKCSGTETDLATCPHKVTGRFICGDEHIAGVECRGKLLHRKAQIIIITVINTF